MEPYNLTRCITSTLQQTVMVKEGQMQAWQIDELHTH